MEIADIIRKARNEKKLSQRALAKLVRRSGAAVAQWELGQTMPDWEIRPLLAQELSLPLAALMPEIAAAGGGLPVADPMVLAAARLLEQFPESVRESYLVQIGAMADALGLGKGTPPKGR